MSEMITRGVNELPEPERRSLENLLGHSLQSDQQVFVMVFSTGKNPDDATRRAAAESIRRTLETVDRHQATQVIPSDEVEAAIVEAMHHVRPRPS